MDLGENLLDYRPIEDLIRYWTESVTVFVGVGYVYSIGQRLS